MHSFLSLHLLEQPPGLNLIPTQCMQPSEKPLTATANVTTTILFLLHIMNTAIKGAFCAWWIFPAPNTWEYVYQEGLFGVLSAYYEFNNWDTYLFLPSVQRLDIQVSPFGTGGSRGESCWHVGLEQRNWRSCWPLLLGSSPPYPRSSDLHFHVNKPREESVSKFCGSFILFFSLKKLDQKLQSFQPSSSPWSPAGSYYH